MGITHTSFSNYELYDPFNFLCQRLINARRFVQLPQDGVLEMAVSGTYNAAHNVPTLSLGA